MQSEPPIYLDHAATTPVDAEVLDSMLPYFSDRFANPAAIYGQGAEARAAVEVAREAIADSIGATPEEIYFTGGGTESNNWAVKGSVQPAIKKGGAPHLIASQIEHSSILEPVESMRATGCDTDFLGVDSEGIVDAQEVRRLIRTNTVLTSVMVANNEVGSIQPIAEIGSICREAGVPFHCDAVQALGRLPLNVADLKVDLMTFSAHKLYGPKGVGALYIRRGTKLANFNEGGEQERGRRAGTVNVPGIVGFGTAVRLADRRRTEETRRITGLRDRLIDGIKSSVPGARLSGPAPTPQCTPSTENSFGAGGRLPNSVHFCFEGVEGESLLLALDMAGISASAGSACSAGSTEPSHVLLAMGKSVEQARGALRLTLGRGTTCDDIDYTVNRLAAIMGDLRALSVTADLI